MTGSKIGAAPPFDTIDALTPSSRLTASRPSHHRSNRGVLNLARVDIQCSAMRPIAIILRCSDSCRNIPAPISRTGPMSGARRAGSLT